MKKILTAIALTIAFPAMAHAQAGPAPAPKASDHANMMGMMGMMDCKGMAAMKSHDMAGMTKQDHEKMMRSCGEACARGTTTPTAVQPTHKM